MQNPKDGFPMEFVHAARSLGRYRNTEQEAYLLSRILPLASHSKILDICCGFGRLSGKMYSLGYDVTGIDISAVQLSMARSENQGPRYLAMDMRAPPLEKFDALLSMFTSFGYFADPADDIHMLKTWASRLRPDGILVMELADMECARTKLPALDTSFVRHTLDVEEHCQMDWKRGIFKVAYRQGDTEFTCWTRLYEKEKLRDFLLHAGFREVQLFGDLALNNKNPESNLVIVATK
ncbi:dTDP-3-amino-3,6-dideoxy-alpha-D-glucopyranose N,N-dimethyltransferase [Variovorax sp. WDL1]|nr:dTDP-3-amino-3,6-dideoxy-alpha-D-glucopyranose N,N-dimethyltransferase [Variovorax sp. B4]PNG54782.1 dTDP-3-amino-3,6-dideoxy-alpha-D-glucopyranose N,N-dimethyltransferase [Variovorax sp. B2]VTV15783.1 dTDP-3-amino-3,6-dideoxy-alpha-D-glucopyranose N,N-dimethyltransferase [Variovorax sp. WDL1]